MKRQPQRGSALMVTMIITIALLAGAGVLASMQINSNRATDLTKGSTTATHCAEAGLTAAAPYVASTYTSWQANLCTTRPYSTCSQPAYLDNTHFSHDIDGDNVDDFVVFITDNDDEAALGVNDLTKDSDQRIFIVSRCIKYPDTPKEVEELVQYSGGGGKYKSQIGGNQGNGNDN